MAEQIISASGTQYGLIVNPDGSIPVSGTFTDGQIIPTLGNNPAVQIVYIISGTTTGITTGSEIGSIIQFIGTGSYIQVLKYTSNQITSVGSWV